MSTEKSPISPELRTRRRWALLTAAVGVVVVAIVVALVVWRGGADVPSASGETDRPTPGTTQAPIMLGTPTPVATDAAPADSRIPASCAQIYTTDWADSLGPLLVLNPAWTLDTPVADFRASNDTGLLTQLEDTARLTCTWVKEAGGGDVGIITKVAAVTAAQQAALTAYIGGIGYTCYEELDGLRCITEVTGEGVASGESHFIRDGVWLATRWVEASPDGYTHDMVNTIFGG